MKKLKSIFIRKFKRIPKIPKKFLILGAIVLLLLGNFLLARNNNNVVPQFAEVKKQDLKQVVSASGIVTGKDSASLRFKNGGKLSYVKVNIGEVAGKGAVIAGLDTQDLEIALRIAQSNFRDKKATADKIHDDLNGVTAESFTQRQIRTTAEVAQDNAYDSLLGAQRAFQDAVITSPITGLVTQVNAVPGEIVSSSDVIAQVIDFSQIVFQADVDESDISKVHLFQNAEITLNTYGDKVFKGTVIEIIPQTHTTASGATVVTVKVQINDPSVDQISGLNGQINIIIAEKDQVLSVPLDAVRNDNTVFVKTKNGIIARRVTTGFKTDSDIEITKGLSEDEQVVVNQTEAVKAIGTMFRLPFLRIGVGGGSFRNGPR